MSTILDGVCAPIGILAEPIKRGEGLDKRDEGANKPDGGLNNRDDLMCYISGLFVVCGSATNIARGGRDPISVMGGPNKRDDAPNKRDDPIFTDPIL